MGIFTPLTNRQLRKLQRRLEHAQRRVSDRWGGTDTVYRLQDDLADVWWDVADEIRHREIYGPPRRGTGPRPRRGTLWS